MSGAKKRPATMVVAGPIFSALAAASAGLAARAPARLVGVASHLAVRNRRDDRTDVELLVRLDRGLLGAAVFLAPHDVEFGAERDFVVDRAERQRLLLVERVAGE